MQQPAQSAPVTALIQVTITQFRPLGGVFPISTVFTTPQPTPGVSVDDGNVTVTTGCPTSLIFQMADPAFVFVGAAFDAPAADTDVGACEFPRVTVCRGPSGNLPPNSICIADSNLPQDYGKSYSYVLVVQNTATGGIGIIDPVVTGEPGP